MKRRIISCLILVLCIVLSCFALTSCKKKKKDSTSSDPITGKDGVGIQSITADNDGNLIITLTNGTTQTVTLPENASGDYSEGLHFQKIDGSNAYRLIGIGIASDLDIVIPETYKGLPVVEISEYAFYENEDIKSVTIPSSVRTIGECAFADCYNLETINMAEGLNYIEAEAFSSCDSLSVVVIPDSVTTIGESAFEDCDNLFNITLGTGLRYVGEYAFEDCDNLQYLNIKDIASWCMVEFEESSPILYTQNIYLDGALITDLVIPEGVTAIGDTCFAYCDSITSVTLPSSVTSIGYGAFGECDNLQTINFAPTGLEVIEDHAFYGCDNLTLVEIPTSVTRIEEEAFYGCDSLISVAIPTSVVEMYSDVFYACNHLTIFTTYSYAPSGWYSDWNSSNRPVVWNWSGADVTYTLISNGNIVETVTNKYSISLPTYTLDGYVHVGWYNNAYAQGTLYSEGYYDAVNTTLYAYWMTQEEYDRIFADGSSFERALRAVAGETYYVSIASSNQKVYFKFVPTTSGYYQIYSTNNSADSKVYLYDAGYNQIAYDDDGYGTGNNFSLSVELQAGVTYYIGAAMYSTYTGYYNMHISNVY